MPFKDPAAKRAWRIVDRRRRGIPERVIPTLQQRHESKRRWDLAQIKRIRDFRNSCKSKPCADCQQAFPPVCMDFDHVRGKKLRNISSKKFRTFRALQEEMSKCDLVCSNCHRIRTDRRRNEKQ